MIEVEQRTIDRIDRIPHCVDLTSARGPVARTYIGAVPASCRDLGRSRSSPA